jgi:hypothetical protein
MQFDSNGTIKLMKPMPNSYNINYSYTLNNSSYNDSFNIKIKPNISFSLTKIKKKYQSEYINKSLIVSPNGGTFSTNFSDVFINYGYFEISKDKIVDNYNLELNYTINNQTSTYKLELIIEPEFYYSTNTISLNYYDNINSVKPFINVYGGSFYLDKTINGITIDPISGIINFNNVDLGKYNIIVNYIYNNIITSTNFIVESQYLLRYNQMLTINYTENYNIESDKPIVYPLNGKFSVNNSNISIDENTGILKFVNLPVNIYDIFVNYNVNNINTYTTYKLIIKPNIYFEELLITLSYNTIYKSQLPIVNPPGGMFSCNNLPNGFYINKYNGQIIVNNIAGKGNYKLIINYTLNNSIASTNIFINIV